MTLDEPKISGRTHQKLQRQDTSLECSNIRLAQYQGECRRGIATRKPASSLSFPSHRRTISILLRCSITCLFTATRSKQLSSEAVGLALIKMAEGEREREVRRHISSFRFRGSSAPIQGDHSGCDKPPIDTKTKVPF